MMNWRFRASISPLACAGRIIFATISFKTSNGCCAGLDYFINSFSARHISYIQTLTNLQLGRFESLRLLHSSTDEDDDFGELGSPVAQGVGTVLKLMTEKPEPFKKTDPARKPSSATPLPSEGRPSLIDIPLKHSKPSPALRLQLENNNDVSRFNCNSKNASNCETLNAITIENVPSTINLSQLKDAVSVFGEISNVSMKTVSNELGCCNVQFEGIESYRRAISAGGITVGGLHLPIHFAHAPETATIRICNISTETADPAIHSMCMSCGPLEGLVRTEEDAVNAFFIVKDNLDRANILNKLNSTIVDDCKWAAHLLPKDSSPVDMRNDDDNDNAYCKLGSEISCGLANLRRQIYMRKIHVEDLETLHNAILHLEGNPASIGELPESN